MNWGILGVQLRGEDINVPLGQNAATESQWLGVDMYPGGVGEKQGWV